MQGNAAHLMTNFQQLGPSQQIEDAMILGALLPEAKDRAGLEAALHAYDVVRRPRSQWVSEHGKRLGWLWTGMVEDVGIDVKKLKAAMLKWKADSEAFDLEEHRHEALKLMTEGLNSKSSESSVASQEFRLTNGFKNLLSGEVASIVEQVEL